MTVKVCLNPPLNPDNQTRFTDTAVTLVRLSSMTGASGGPTNNYEHFYAKIYNAYVVNNYFNYLPSGLSE